MAESLTNKKGKAPPGFAVRAALALRKTFQRAADACVPSQLAAFEHLSGVAHTMIVGELARLRIPDLVVERPDDRVAAWSTDPRAGVPGLPSLDLGAKSPRCLRTVAAGRTVYTAGSGRTP